MKNNTKIKQNTFYSLGILAIFIFEIIIIPAKANATSNGYYNVIPYDNTSYYNSYYNSAPYQPPIYTPPPAPTPIVYSTSVNPNATNPVAVAPTTKTTSTSNTATSPTTSPESASNLAANVVYGTNSFLPSGLIQWILFAIFILFLVILARIVLGAKKKYHATPMKHE